MTVVRGNCLFTAGTVIHSQVRKGEFGAAELNDEII